MNSGRLTRKTPLRTSPDSVREWQDRTRATALAKSRETPTTRRKRGARTSGLTAEQKARKAAEVLRTMGPPARQRMIRETPCESCGALPSENSHNHTDGTSRRADARHISNLCAWCHRLGPQSFHRLGSVAAFDAVHGTDLTACAARNEARWQAHPSNPANR